MKSFLIAEILGLHDEKSVCLEVEEVPKPTKNPELEKYQCEVCQKRFSEKHQLSYHARLHDRNKCCPSCGEFFRSKSKFKNHLRTAHATGKIQCGQCEKRWLIKQTLNCFFPLIWPWQLMSVLCGKRTIRVLAYNFEIYDFKIWKQIWTKILVWDL